MLTLCLLYIWMYICMYTVPSELRSGDLAGDSLSHGGDSLSFGTPGRERITSSEAISLIYRHMVSTQLCTHIEIITNNTYSSTYTHKLYNMKGVKCYSVSSCSQ